MYSVRVRYEEPSVAHQGIILVQTNSAADKVCDYYNKFYPSKCAIYLSSTQPHRDVIERFVNGEIHTMATAIELLDEFNYSSASMLGIAFTISHSSRPIDNWSFYCHSTAQVYPQWSNTGSGDLP